MDEPRADAAEGVDIGEYCRHVEECLARVNDGHLIRIVGPAFELIRGWAIEGIPLSLVCHGIARKAERHRLGRAKRALRLEFCEPDVRAAYDDWRRAVGVWRSTAPADEGGEAAVAAEPRRRPSLAAARERALERVVRAANRVDAAASLRETLDACAADLAALRDEARAARGAARADLAPRLDALDDRLAAAARAAAAPALLDEVRREATADLTAYRTRLTEEAWTHSLNLTIDRMLRERMGLPSLPR